jgi:hypothetical protein
MTVSNDTTLTTDDRPIMNLQEGAEYPESYNDKPMHKKNLRNNNITVLLYRFYILYKKKIR